MNTPSHLVINVALLGDDRGADRAALLGAALPDLPMFFFFAWVRGVERQPMEQIWSETYFQPGWQDFFDVFNSVPLAGALWLLAWWRGWRHVRIVAESMVLHQLIDFTMHNDDAHRHFLPLSDWRFESPLSYWDVDHHAAIVGPAESVAAVAACAVLRRRYADLPVVRRLVALTAVAAIASAGALIVWALRR